MIRHGTATRRRTPRGTDRLNGNVHAAAGGARSEASLNSFDRFRRRIPTTAPATQEETDMSAKKALPALAVTAALVALGAASAAASDHERGDRDRTGSVRPCSLAGVNPVYHPEIFGNPAAAESFGFVLGPDRVWRVRANCRPY
jgi:hypothetical protein